MNAPIIPWSRRLCLLLLLLAGCLPFGAHRNGELLPYGDPLAPCVANAGEADLRIPSAEIGKYGACWYTEALDSLREIRLDHPLAPEDTVLRLLWVRTFHPPVAIRLQNIGGGWSASISVSEGQGGYRIGKFRSRQILRLSDGQVDTLLGLLAATPFDPPPATLLGGSDGAQWVFELVTGPHYRLRDRHSPQPATPFRALGDWMIGLIEAREVREPIY